MPSRLFSVLTLRALPHPAPVLAPVPRPPPPPPLPGTLRAQPRASESREQIPAPARRPPACGSQDAGVCTLHHPALRPPTKHRAFIVEVCTWMPRVIAFSTQAHTALWRHQHRSHRTVVVRSSRTAAHSVLQTHVCINCVSTRAHPCSGSVVQTTNGADSVCVRSAAACGRGSSSDWPLTGLRPRPTRSRRTRRPPSGTQHAPPSSHRARRQLDVRPRPCAGPARPARGPCKEARTTQRTRFLCRGACCVVASSGRAA